MLDSVSNYEKQKLSNRYMGYRKYQEICVKSAIESRNRDDKSSIELEFASKFANCQYVSDLAARSWRDVGRSYSFNFYQKIVSGLYVTTANILDAMIGGIIDAVNIYINPYNRVRTDFRFFNDLTIKINLNYVWWGHYDFFDKDALLAKIESSYRWDDILFRVLPNIFVVVVFISLAICIVYV